MQATINTINRKYFRVMMYLFGFGYYVIYYTMLYYLLFYLN